jgi:hypothetical protein
VKPLDLKIGWLHRLGYEAEDRGGWLYIWSYKTDRWGREVEDRMRVLMLVGNPTYRRIREGLRAHFHESRAG